jgi:hypothetical protein
MHADRHPEQVVKSERGKTVPTTVVRPRPIRVTPTSLGDAMVQAKLRVGPGDDVYEREADEVADRVVRSLAAASSSPVVPGRSSTGRIRRASASGLEGSVGEDVRDDRVAASSSLRISPAATVAGRVQRAGFTYGGAEEVRGSITSQVELRKGVERVLDETFVGVRALFTSGGIATTVESWGKLLFGLLSEDNDMEGLSPTDCEDIVQDIKAEHRKEQFLQISEFYGYFQDSYGKPIWSLDDLKDELSRHHITVDEDGKDDATLELLLDVRGDREALQEEPHQSFQIGPTAHNLDPAGLKSELDDELGGPVNWGHEINECMDDAGKKGEMYYYQSGKGLTPVGNSTQSHASSKGGRTIIWERAGGTTEILAIGKHTTRGDSSLSKGASYEILATFGAGYAGYRGKIIGFKSS